MLIFGKNKVECNSLADLEKADPELYASFVEEVTGEANQKIESLTNENNELKSKVEKSEENAKILSYGKKLGQEIKAQECIDNNMSYTKSLEAIMEASSENKEDLSGSFENSASDPLGQAPDGGEDDNDKPETFAEACKIVQEREKCTFSEASEIAQVEFASLFNKMYPKR